MSEHGKPKNGMCCLCTMEDITEEDGNYGELTAQMIPFNKHVNMSEFSALEEKVCIFRSCLCFAIASYLFVKLMLCSMRFNSWIPGLSIYEMETCSIWTECSPTGEHLNWAFFMCCFSLVKISNHGLISYNLQLLVATWWSVWTIY